jgi:hypothetical protein
MQATCLLTPDNANNARKLAVILHRMWRDQTEFRFGKEPIATVSRAAA